MATEKEPSSSAQKPSSSTPVRVVIESAPPSSPPNDEKKTEHNRKKRRKIIKFWAEIVVGFFVIVYATFAVFQWLEMKKAADAAKGAANTADATLKEIRLENRPWVVVKSASVVTVKPGEQAQVLVTFSNFGRTPALETRIVARLHITSDPQVDVPELRSPEDEVTSGILAPTMEETITLHSVDKVNPAQVQRAKVPDVRYYVYGTGTYQDTTTERAIHHLEFCVFARYAIIGITPCTNKRYKNATD